MIILGIESTAHTFGIGIVKDKEILANIKRSYTTEEGGIIPIQAAKHHQENKIEIYFEALNKAGIKEKDIDAIAFSQGPGLAPCLLEGMKFAKELVSKLKKPIVPVNHCVAHLEIGEITGAKDAVMLYVSGANTQVIAYGSENYQNKFSDAHQKCQGNNKSISETSGKYRVFGETLDIGVGNFIDSFARYAGIGFPGGPKIENLAKKRKNYVELPYRVKGMDIALSGILTNLKQKIEKIKLPAHLHSRIDKKQLNKNSLVNNFNELRASDSERDYSLADLAYSMQETIFAMLVEIAERALAHTEKKELLLGGGVACNSRLQEMCEIMCKERNAKFFCPPNDLLTDNGSMIAYTGEVLFNNGNYVRPEYIDSIDIKPRERTDDVEISWR